MRIRCGAWLPAVLLLGACAPDEGSAVTRSVGAAAERGAVAQQAAAPPIPSDERTPSMELGNFCVCLSVKDLAASLAFYEKLGFTKVSGEASQGWLVLKNGAARVGIFQGHLEKNTLSFNPGWTADAQPLAKFEDVRDLQRKLKERGITPEVEADPATTGPAYFIVKDPDGNPIFVDQHVPRPAR